MTDLQNFVAVMANGDEKFKMHWNDDVESSSKFVDFSISNDGGKEPIHLRAVFDNITGKFEYFNGACEYDV